MMNFRVEDLDGLLEKLRGEGVWIDPNREGYDYGRFAWIMDPRKETGLSCGNRRSTRDSGRGAKELNSLTKAV